MPTINSIPPEYLEGFQDLMIIEDNDFDSVVNLLKEAPFTSSIEKLAITATSFQPSLHETVENIFVSAGSITSLIEKGVSIEEAAEDIFMVMVITP